MSVLLNLMRDRVLTAIAIITALLAVSGTVYGQWSPAERQAAAAERQAEAAEAQAHAARWERIERCFARGERERCIAMMNGIEQSHFAAMEGSAMAGRGLAEALRALSAAPSAQEQAVAHLRALHPDYEQIMADPSFRRWVADSSTRQELLAKANAQYDVAAADMLFSTWKQMRARQ